MKYYPFSGESKKDDDLFEKEKDLQTIKTNILSRDL
tara:strand:- start:131 stop:238 length:108 start_codon:yes stop_codon:yes gene_type:complete